MVSCISIIGMVFTFFISILVPVLLAVWIKKKGNYSQKALWVGVLVFLVFQLLTRIPLIQTIYMHPLMRSFAKNHFFYNVFFLSLSAACFEEIGRFIGFRFVLKDRLSYCNGIAYGIGHGGGEAALLVGLASINNIVNAFLINFGKFDSLVEGKIPPMAINSIRSQLITTDPSLFFAGGIERLFTLALQIALSLIVLYSVQKRRWSLLGLSVLLHTVINFCAGSLSKCSVWYSEMFVGVMAVGSVLFIIKAGQLKPKNIPDKTQ